MPSHQLHAEIEQLKERNRLLHIKSREERQKLEEEFAALRYRDESQSRRLEEKQARLDELEIQAEKAHADRQQVQSQLAELQKRLDEVEQNGTPVPDLRGKVGDIASYVKCLIAEDRKLTKNRKQDTEVKLPKGAMSKFEEILLGETDEPD